MSKQKTQRKTGALKEEHREPGRPKTRGETIHITTRLSADLVEWLRAKGGSLTQQIEAVLRKARGD